MGFFRTKRIRPTLKCPPTIRWREEVHAFCPGSKCHQPMTFHRDFSVHPQFEVPEGAKPGAELDPEAVIWTLTYGNRDARCPRCGKRFFVQLRKKPGIKQFYPKIIIVE